jgi:ribonuclease E
MKRMLFNATHAEELRVAIVDGQKLIDLDLESSNRSEKKGNIYKGKVTKVEPSLEACFVEYGSEKQGFLPLKEIYREYFTSYDSRTPISDVKIDSVIKEGQEMIVQVDKDERGTKGAALTTFVSLAGRFLVFMPNNPKGGGISRRIAGDERSELRQILSNLSVDSRHSLIARTEGIGRSQEELQWDLDFLVKLWDTVEHASTSTKAPFLIYQESNLIVRSIRDHLSDDIAEVVVDDEEVYDRAARFINQVMPQSINKLKIYKDTVPLFSRYQIENQINSAFNREVSLPSGGSLAIDHTEALISIDVNSARATKGGDIEETALHTNLEAVEEVARQLRIRDIGGLVVIDLIDMTISRNQRAVENRLKDSLHADRARVQVGNISQFGMLEMSRQRLRSSISDMNYRVCPRCDGMGTIRSVVSSSLNMLRIIEDEALKENTEAIQVVLPLDMATYILNEKRHELYQLEARLVSRIIIIPSDELASPHFELKRLKSNELDELAGVSSFDQVIELEKTDPNVTDSLKTSRPERAVVQLDQIDHSAPPEQKTSTKDNDKSSEPGIIRKFISALAGSDSKKEEPAPQPSETRKPQQRSRSQGKSGSQSGRGRGRSNKPQNRGQGRDGRKTQGRGQGRSQQESGRDTKSGENTPSQQSKSRNQPKNTRSRRGAQGDNQSNGKSQQSQSRSQQPRSNANKPHGHHGRKPRAEKAHPGPVISVENIPADLPDDIGNRKD